MEPGEPLPVLSLTQITSAARQLPTLKPPITIMSLNYDVLARIFENVAEPVTPGSRSLKKPVLWAALTCRSFQYPALDALWKSLHTVVPLLQLLPTIERVNGVYNLCGEIKNKDKERFDFYAKKVKVLSLDGQCGNIDPFVLTVLPLLPCLQRIICPSYNELEAQNTLLFLSSTLREVVFFPGSPSPSFINSKFQTMRRFLYALHTKAPHIHHLVLCCLPDNRLWKSVLRFRSLRSLEVNESVDFITLRNIVSLPELQHLTVHAIHAVESRSNSDDDTLIPCLKLCSLELSGRGHIIASYLSRMRGGCLSDISITMLSHFDQTGLWETCLTVMENQWASTLRHLRLSSDNHYPIDSSPQFFISLSKIRALEHLVIKGQLQLNKSHSLASAIPRIKIVSISRVKSPPFFLLPREDRNCGSSFQPDFLGKFAMHCPHLISLSVDYFDGVYSPSALFLPSHPYRHNQLRTLHFPSEDSLRVDNLQHAIDVARHLDHIFPSLKVIHTQDKSKSADFWRYVEKLVHEFQRVRRQTVERLKEVGV